MAIIYDVSRYPEAGSVFKKLDTQQSEILTNFLDILQLV